jgi:hypothetical protein
LATQVLGHGDRVTSIAIVRVPSFLGGSARAYKILVDGVESASLRGDAEANVEVAPGHHVVQARIDWTGSEEIPVSVGPGETVSMGVAPATETSLGQLRAMFGRNSSLKLWII